MNIYDSYQSFSCFAYPNKYRNGPKTAIRLLGQLLALANRFDGPGILIEAKNVRIVIGCVSLQLLLHCAKGYSFATRDKQKHDHALNMCKFLILARTNSKKFKIVN